MSKTQIEKTSQRGDNIFSSLLSLAKPLIKPATKALASAGLSFGSEKALKKIFRNGYGPNEIKLYKLTQAMAPEQKKAVEKYLVGWGWFAVEELGSTADFLECWCPLACL